MMGLANQLHVRRWQCQRQTFCMTWPASGMAMASLSQNVSDSADIKRESVAIRLYHRLSGCIPQIHAVSLVSLWRFHHEAQAEVQPRDQGIRCHGIL